MRKISQWKKHKILKKCYFCPPKLHKLHANFILKNFGPWTGKNPGRLTDRSTPKIFHLTLQKITKITSLSIPKSVKVIESFAFAENKELETIIINDNDDENNELIIESFAFQNNIKLTSFKIPKQLKQFDSNVFKGCSNIKEISVSKDHEKYQVKENVLFDKEGKKLLFYSPGLQNDYYFIPSTVKEIEQKSFIMNDIELIQFSNQVNTISESLNYGNKNLTTLYIPETMNYIDSYSFSIFKVILK